MCLNYVTKHATTVEWGATTKTYYAKNEDEAKQKAENDETIVEEIILIPEPPEPPPTQRQLAYAQSLGIYIPPNATINDVSILIDMKKNNDKQATERHKSFAEYFNIHLSTKYIGKKALFNIIFHALCEQGREKDLVAWFAFRIYRHLVKGEYENIEIEYINDPIIETIANQLANDEKIISSIRRYEGQKLIWFGEFTGDNGTVYTGASKTTAAYKTISKLLREKTNLPERTTQPNRTQHNHRQPTTNTYTSNVNKKNLITALVIVIVLIVIMYYKTLLFGE